MYTDKDVYVLTYIQKKNHLCHYSMSSLHRMLAAHIQTHTDTHIHTLTSLPYFIQHNYFRHLLPKNDKSQNYGLEINIPKTNVTVTKREFF